MGFEDPIQIWSGEVSGFPLETSSPTQMYTEFPKHGLKKRKLASLSPVCFSGVEEESLSMGTSVSGDDVKPDSGDGEGGGAGGEEKEENTTVEQGQARENALSIRDWKKEAWTEKTELMMNEPYNYLISHPGKDIRKQMIAACNIWLQVDCESLDIVGESVSMLHNASLLIDDIQDSSRVRRGFPVAHDVYGVARTINSANYVYFKAQQHLLKLHNWPAAIQIFNEELLNLHRGQGMDLFWRDTLTIPTEKDYLQMISNKTGGLFRLMIRLMMTQSRSGIDLVPFIEIMGLIFQIQDDYKNLTCDQMSSSKGYCEDLTEGKFSFPIIHAIRHSPSDNNTVMAILKLKTEDHALKEHVVRYMSDSVKSFDYTKRIVQDLHVQASQMMEKLQPCNPSMKLILDKLVAG